MEQIANPGSAYLLEIGLEELHKESVVWKSRLELWKTELKFFQKLLDKNSVKFVEIDDKKAEDHFQNLILYYDGELLEEYKQSVRRHEKRLGEMLSDNDRLQEIEYRNNHIALKEKVDSFDDTFRKYKQEFFAFMEKAI